MNKHRKSSFRNTTRKFLRKIGGKKAKDSFWRPRNILRKNLKRLLLNRLSNLRNRKVRNKRR